MSFNERKELIEVGDTVIIYLSAKSMHAIEVKPTKETKHGKTVENVFQTTYGALKVCSLVGKRFGSKISLSRGWAYVIHPTPELWTRTLPHRTQILYFADISMIVMQLEIRPGSVVVESGTGSGSLSHALIRSVKPGGALHTFDFHAHRVEVARREFECHGLGGYVHVEQRDVAKDGFGPRLYDAADAVFLDLPKPWEVVRHVVVALRESGGRFVSFSPCIEQVQRTCEALEANRFVDVVTLECLQKEYQVLTRNLPLLRLDHTDDKPDDNKTDTVPVLTAVLPTRVPGHTGYLTCASLPPVWARRRSPISSLPTSV